MSNPKQKFQGGGLTNRNPIITSVVKGRDDKGSYTDTNTNQADDFYKGVEKKKHIANAWFNSLTPAQKLAHNQKVRAEEALKRAASPDTMVKGTTSTNRVYDTVKAPVAKAPTVPVRRWTREEVVTPFGSHVTTGSTTDDAIIARGLAKNKMDLTIPAAKKNTYVTRDFTPKEMLLWEKGRLSDKDNPIGKDTIGRGARLDRKIAIMTAPRKKPGVTMPASQVAVKADGGKMLMINGKILKKKPVLKAKPKLATNTNASNDGGDDCGCGKMQVGGQFQPSGQYAGSRAGAAAIAGMTKQAIDMQRAAQAEKLAGLRQVADSVGTNRAYPGRFAPVKPINRISDVDAYRMRAAAADLENSKVGVAGKSGYVSPVTVTPAPPASAKTPVKKVYPGFNAGGNRGEL